MSANKFIYPKIEEIHPSCLNVGDTYLIDDRGILVDDLNPYLDVSNMRTVGCNTVKSGFHGVTLDGCRSNTVKRVLWAKVYKGNVIGYQAQL